MGVNYWTKTVVASVDSAGSVKTKPAWLQVGEDIHPTLGVYQHVTFRDRVAIRQKANFKPFANLCGGNIDIRIQMGEQILKGLLLVANQ